MSEENIFDTCSGISDYVHGLIFDSIFATRKEQTMSREKQIEEMGKLCPFHEEGKCNLLEDEAVECNFDCDMCDFAKNLYNAGYRKQSEGEWVKVYRNKKCTVYECSNCKHLTFGTSDYCICGAKMKGSHNEETV